MSPAAGRPGIAFSIHASPGSEVYLVGTFNDWKPGAHPLREVQAGDFSRHFSLPDGVHEYKYRIDGEWRIDPIRPWTLNPFGAANNIIDIKDGREVTRTQLGSGRIKARLEDDVYLRPHLDAIERRRQATARMEARLTGGQSLLSEWAQGHTYYGLHRFEDGWVFREWAPAASAVSLVGEFCEWDPRRGRALDRINEKGDWEARFARELLKHGDLYRLQLEWPGGGGERLPSHAQRVVQDPTSHIFTAQVWDPPSPYVWKHPHGSLGERPLLVYESHVGLAQEEGKVGTYEEFRQNVLPRVVKGGYTALQLMAVMEHPYYGSFGYHVANFFAASSRFGSPEELKALVDAAHGEGLVVIMDLVHSHAVKNEVEGLSRFDGTLYQYFHDGPRGNHDAWDSRCFDYAKPEVLHFLLSNCRYWLDEYRFDGFRFDGVTSMLYTHHGLGSAFDSYGRYFDDTVDEEAYVYLALANKAVHEAHPDAVTIAEDVSGMPGLGAEIDEGGCGFDARLAMGIPDFWFELSEERDEDWNVERIWHELTNRRSDERTISYVESHDQALVGGKTFIFELIDAAMYDGMGREAQNLLVDRGVALHKMARLATLATCDAGYLNFIGNEFGHPEWVDFPRQGNNWSYHFARRQWSLRDNQTLRYHGLGEFDEAMIATIKRKDVFPCPLERRYEHVSDQVLAFSRGMALFVFNFHPTRSHSDYHLPVLAGNYRLLLNSDDTRFAGHGRLEPEQIYQGGHGAIRVYLPTRTALVLERVRD